ncbi:unnamed protein product [Oreochromis niloticus]|nr:unnamed protein product [Mustela putorius furo]
MVESNVTLDAQTVLSAINSTSLSLTNGQTVQITNTELVAECLIVGTDTNCNCSTNYLWSNEVCYNYSCCGDATCTQNVSYITPLCSPKVQVFINGSVQTAAWDQTKNTTLQSQFQKLNAIQYVNVTGPRIISISTQVLNVADFQVAVSVRVLTSKLQEIVTFLETQLSATIFVDTLGMVIVEAPGTKVCYQSTPQLACKLEEPTGSAGWNMTTQTQRFELNNGSVVQLNQTCATSIYQSCIGVTLKGVTGIWEGTYECGFTIGSIRHTGRTFLSVALLPDTITMSTMPLTMDCSKSPQSVNITASVIIPASSKSYDISWSYNGSATNYTAVQNTTSKGYVNYTFTPTIPCTKGSGTYVNITFKNDVNQMKSAQINIPVINANDIVCNQIILNGDTWPETPAGETVIIRTCPPGRVGYKSRTCIGPAWQDVFSSCVSEELDKVSNAAQAFLKGLGATPEVAKNIFEGLKNSSTLSSGSGESIADVSASIGVLNMMAKASNTTVLGEDIFPDFVSAASNMLNGTWNGVNDTVRYNMSSNYLNSVEGLVKNIKVNQSNGVNSTNLDLTFCRSHDCNVSVFDIGVNMNKTNGILKTVAVKNLMSKLNNSFNGAKPDRTDLILSATLDNNNDSTRRIRLDFPSGKTNPTQPHCVFWNPTGNEWSDEGCNISISDENHTVCECNHLTAFSVLMSKNDGRKTDPTLELISNIGLGVSICSLVIFLIIESLVWSAVVKTNLSHFRHTAIVNIATFLLLANCSFLASSNPETLSDSWCLVLTICKHLFYLAMFCWMLCLSIMLVHQLIFVFSPLRKRVFMFLSSILGYVCPILMVGSSYVYYKYTNQNYHDPKTCWLVYVKLLVGSMHAFLLPVGTIVLANLFSMVVVIVTLMKTSVPDSSKADDKETAKGILKVVIVLTPVFGVTWIVGFIQLIMSDSPMYNVIAYIFTILNTFQGFFILITGCFAEQKVREELFKLITGKSKGNDSTKKFTSTTYTKDH